MLTKLIKKKNRIETKETSEIIGSNINLISTNANLDSNNDEKVNVNIQNKKKIFSFLFRIYRIIFYLEIKNFLNRFLQNLDLLLIR